MNRIRRPVWWSRVGHTRGRLIGLASIAAIPITGMAAVIGWQTYRSVVQLAQERATLLDGLVLAEYDAAIRSVADSVAAAVPHLSGGRCDPSIGDSMGRSVVSLLTYDARGRVTCEVGTRLPPPNRPLGWLGQVRSGSPPVMGRFGSEGRAALALPAMDGDVVVAVLPPLWLDTHVLPRRAGAGDAVWLLDQDRQVVASRGAAAEALPTIGTMATLIATDQRAMQARSAAGLHYAYATTRLMADWRLIVATSARRDHDKALRETLIRLAELAALLVAGLFTVVLGADLAFGNPLRRLSTAVRTWQAGSPFDPGDLSGAPDEVLQLAQSFRDATAGLRQREAELLEAKDRQNLLVLEVHHRVKNNLQVIASLLNLQASRIRVPEARAEFQAARDRVRALATLHRHLYADGELHTINMRSFLVELCAQLFQAMGEMEGKRISLQIEAPELRMSSDQAVPLALIVTEAVTNSVRYAFPGGRSGHVAVMLTEHAGELDLVISDDGVGIPAGQAQVGARDGIGLQLIRGFSRQLGATLTVEEQGGTRYAVRLARVTRNPAEAVATPGAQQDDAG